MPASLAILGSRGHLKDVLNELPGVDEFVLTAVSPAGQSEPFSAVTDFCKARSLAPTPFDDWRELLDRARPDAVVVCGPFEDHAEMCVAAVERGVHVLTEKPAALTLPDYERLAAACAANPGVHVAAMVKSRFHPAFLTAQRLVSSGTVGTPRLLEARKSYRLGSRPDYYHHRSTYGGTVPWVGSHALDLVLWLSGAAPTTVFAAHHAEPGSTMERAAVISLALRGGVLASVAIDYHRPAAAPTHGDDFLRLVGSDGVIEVRPDSPEPLHLIAASHSGAIAPDPPARSQLRDFHDHLSGVRPSLVTTGQTLLLTLAGLLALRSADTGQVVHFPR